MSKPDFSMLRHANTTPSLALTNSVTTTAEIRNDLWENLGFVITAHATAASLTYQVSHDGVTYKALNNSSNAAVGHNISADKAYAIAAEAKPFPFIKLVLDAGTATIQVVRKS